MGLDIYVWSEKSIVFKIIKVAFFVLNMPFIITHHIQFRRQNIGLHQVLTFFAMSLLSHGGSLVLCLMVNGKKRRDGILNSFLFIVGTKSQLNMVSL